MCTFIAASSLHFSVFAQTALQQLQSFTANTQSLQGQFVQIAAAGSAGSPGRGKAQSGSFALQKPAQFRWDMQKPFAQLIVSDGKTLTVWDADLNQATVRSAANLLANTPAALLLGGADVNAQFTLTEMPERESFSWVSAKPKRADSQFNTILLGFKNGLPMRLEVEDSFGGKTIIELKNLETSKPAAGVFRFTPPAGADVVRQ